jgi:PAS domain S-box-containing protein
MAERIFEAFMEPVRDNEKRIAGATGVALDVTESLNADRVAQRFFDISADSFVIISSEGEFISANRAYLEATGFELEERIGTSSIGITHPDDQESLRKAFENLRNGVPIIALDLRVRCKNGNYKNFIWNAVIGPEDGLVYASGKDVTQRLIFERALREREEQLRLFVKHSPAALAMFDRDMNYIVLSERWYKDYRLNTQDIVGKNHYEIFPEINQEWKDVHRRCLAGNTESCQREKFVRADGSVDWVRWESKPWYNSDGEIGGLVLFTEVITKQVEAEIELEHTRGLARQIVDASLDAVVAVDSRGFVTEWNPQAEKIFGYTRAEALGESLHDLIVPETFVHAHCNGMGEYNRTGHSHILNQLLQLPARHKDGHEIQIELSICPLKEGSEVHFSSFIRDITERVKREREFAENRAKLKEAQRIAKLGAWEYIQGTDQMFISEEKLVIMGRENLQMPIGIAEFHEFIHPEDRHFFAEANENIAKGQNSASFRYRMLRPDGEVRHVLSEGIVERDESGAPVRMFGTTLDVSDRVLAEERIRESEKRLALALDGSSDGFWDWNVVSGDCFFSSRIIEWLEYDPSSFEHHINLWEKLIDPKSLSIFNRAFEEHVRNRSTHYEIEERVRTFNGNWIWVLSRGKIVEWNEDGTPLRAAGTWTNITERKIMEARASQLGRILDNSVNEVFVIDPESWRFLEANLRARSNTGYALEELQSMTISALVKGWKEDEFRAFIAPLYNASAEAVTGTGVQIRKDGSTYDSETSLQIMEWNDRFVLVSIGSDVTEKLRAEREFQNLENRIRHNQRLETIGTLAGGIAHDFNNILTPILGYADIAASELDPASPCRQDIEHVIQAAYRAKGLVQQILAFSRHDEQARQPLKIDLVVKETVRLLSGSTPRNTDFVQNVQNVGTILSDPTFINQILMNLCTNSFQAIGDCGGTVEVTLRTHEFEQPTCLNGCELANGKYALLMVRDTGTGMDNATRERIFEPFFTTKDVGHGTGLGLSVVHGIVKSHGGAIDVTSEDGKGTTVSVFLPLVDSDIQTELATSWSDNRGSEHVLLCDDDDTILLLAKQMLEGFGYQVTDTSDPVAALAILAEVKTPVSVLIVDDMMPILTGIDVAKSAHDFNASLPVILLSAGGCADEDAVNFAAVLSKPVSSGELAKQVRKCIDNPIKENYHEQNSHH